MGRANRSGQLQRSAYQDEIPKTAEKMMALMAIATSLAPGAKIDEQVWYINIGLVQSLGPAVRDGTSHRLKTYILQYNNSHPSLFCQQMTSAGIL